MNTTLTAKTESIKSKRISKCALTHQQSVADVMGSLVIDKQHDHLTPIVENAVKAIVLDANKVRLSKAATACMGRIDAAMTDAYYPNTYTGGWTAASEGPDGGFIDAAYDEQGNLIRRGHWVFEGSVEYDASYSASELVHFCEDTARLTEAVDAANYSAVFKAIGAELLLTEDLLVYIGQSHN